MARKRPVGGIQSWRPQLLTIEEAIFRLLHVTIERSVLKRILYIQALQTPPCVRIGEARQGRSC